MFQQGSSDWCIMTTLKKTPENRLSISRTTLITTVLEQNCSVKQCCSYFSFTLSTSNRLHGNTLDFQEYKVNGVCRLFPRTWFRRSVKYSWAKFASFAHKHEWLTPSEGQETSKPRVQESMQGSCPWHSHLQPPLIRRNDAQQPRAPRHLPPQTALSVTKCASAQVKSKPWAFQWDLRATDLLVLLVSYFSTQSRVIYLHKCSSSHYHTPCSRNKYRAIKIKMLKIVNRLLSWTQALIFSEQQNTESVQQLLSNLFMLPVHFYIYN